MRCAAVNVLGDVLGKLPPETLAQHSASLIATLENRHSEVRDAAVDVLGKLPPEPPDTAVSFWQVGYAEWERAS